MINRIIFIIIFLISAFAYGQDSTDIKFIWKAAEFNNQQFDHAIMLIPVKFKNDTTTYFLQFDTGASSSYIYSKRFKKDIFVEELVQTSIGNLKFKKNETMKATQEKFAAIGTLGANFLKDKVLKIDFEDQIIQIENSYEPNNFKMIPITLLDNRPIIQIKLNGKRRNMLYDTGSSLFGIWTNKKNWNKIRDTSKEPHVFPISSWGKVNKGFYSTIDTSIGSENCWIKEGTKVWYVDNRKFKRFFKRNDLYGIIGNQPFLKKQILIDYKNKLLGIKCNNG